MAKDYDELVAFMKANSSNPLALAKIMTAWMWTSLFPSGVTDEPTSVREVPTLLGAECGWRDLLMEALFAEIGIPHRRANFHDVPFQVNHSASELFIGGKWIFFDATFGLYLTSKSGEMLSMAEARDIWPNVIVKQCVLDGWQGEFVDPDDISANAFATYSDPFFFNPMDGISYRVVGEINSLYFGYKQTTLDGTSVANDAGDHTFSLKTDTADKANWKRIITTLDGGKLDFQFGYYDSDQKNHSWFKDTDQNDSFDWARQTTYIRKGNVVDARETVFDDSSRMYVNFDEEPFDDFDWSVITTYYLSNGKPEKQAGTYDDGQSWLIVWDGVDQTPYQRYEDRYDANGTVLTTKLVFDNGTSSVVDWSTVNTLAGTSGANTLMGTDGVDVLRGFAGNDVLSGGGNADRMEGGPGNDTYYPNETGDLLIEKANEGRDTVVAAFSHVLVENFENLVLAGTAVYGAGNAAANAIRGNDAGNVLSGFAGNDKLYGEAGNDKLVGGLGRDLLDGGLGADRLYGSAGADTFFWRSAAESPPSARDFVFDFSRDDGDRLSFALIDAKQNVAGNQAFTFIEKAAFTASGQIRYTHSGSETLIVLNVDQDTTAEAIIRLAGHHTPEKAWFIL